MWKVKDAKEKIQERYDKLAKLYKGNQIKQIGELYDEKVVICARKSRRIFRGPDGAVEFWKWVKKDKKVQAISFKVDRVVLSKAHEFVQLGKIRFGESIQRVTYFGRLKYTLATNDPEERFGGDGGHLFVCDPFGRNEDYEF
jgi:hypothetical protein